jgi:hypothetical protein
MCWGRSKEGPQSTPAQRASVGLLAVIAAKPLLKTALVLGLLFLIAIGVARSGGNGFTLIGAWLVVLVFLFWPRRRT